MSQEIEVRYLMIDWQSMGIARAIEAASVPLEIESSTEGEFVIESTIFNDFHPWLGIRLGSRFEGLEPTCVTASGQEAPMLRVLDPFGSGFWWLRDDGWDYASKRHLSELQRSPGTYNIRIGDVVLRVENRLSAFGRADIQAYIDDFRGDLLWMVINDGAGATATGTCTEPRTELADALEELHNASQRVLASPAVTIREGQAPQPISKVRPNTASFREYARNPVARQLTSRVFDRAEDIAENRYLRHMLSVSLKVAGAYLSAASQQSNFLERLASQENERAQNNRELEKRPVDPRVFDQQTEEITYKLNKIINFQNLPDDEMGRVGRFPICLGRRYYNEHSFYYTPQEGTRRNVDNDVDYRVIVLPVGLFELILGTYHFCRRFTIKGSADSCIRNTKSGKQFRQIKLNSVHEVVPQTEVLEKRTEKKQRLEVNNWHVRLTPSEKAELEREAKTGERRARRALDKKEEISFTVGEIERRVQRLAVTDDAFNHLGVQRSSNFPLGMRFVSNPDYAACLSAFNKVRDFFERGGLDMSKLEAISDIGILHASDIYEKWCLLKILQLLQHDFQFKAERGWEEKLIATSLGRATNVSFEFSRDDLEMKVTLTCQAEMPSGRRPDFILEVVNTDKELSWRQGDEVGRYGGIVMDAKFRSHWKKDELHRMLDELVLVKGYDKAVESGKVFILQPCESTVYPVTSPLEWGAHCNYGGTDSHHRGWIQTGVKSSGTRSTQHLKRLLALLFQSVFPEPQETANSHGEWEWVSHSFCIGCGERHRAIKAKRTKSGAMRWQLDCKQCGVWTLRTHCYDCKAPLFKSGTMWTYHDTIAEQVTNVICPGCGSHFDKELI
ncbi:nuclease domain-containing protein [Halomonas sp. Bachu 37]|uniref:nuclease domain-containing protein n=1 Tax=Halomonas kashgarensis TaxID=3084920 RepID=UPI003217B211